MGSSLYDKVLDLHTVRRFSTGQVQLLIGLHLIYEVTSPQAFEMLRERGLGVRCPDRTFATADHVVPSTPRPLEVRDALARALIEQLERNAREFGIRYFAPGSGRQGIVHVIAPELGLTQPGMTICCGDSHTATHGAFGAIAFGIGTTQVRDVLASQSLLTDRLRVRRIEVNGTLGHGVEAKDVILYLIHRLGVEAGVGFAHEYAGAVFDAFSMEERMTVCNMSIEGGAPCGYVNPDETTYAYLRGRPFAPPEGVLDGARTFWDSVRSDPDARYADVRCFDGAGIEPMVTWGITPAQSVPVTARLPELAALAPGERASAEAGYGYMGLVPGQPIAGTPIDVAFVGSCANGRLGDFRRVAERVRRSGLRVHPRVRALLVPGSERARHELEVCGDAELLLAAGFEIGEPGCSMCVGMNGDALRGRQICASSSTRNFKGRQGSPTGRTLLMSPTMVAAAALAGEVVDARQVFGP